MSRGNPCRRRDFVRRMRELGLDGPFAGTRHQFMILGSHRLTIPSTNAFATHDVTRGKEYYGPPHHSERVE